MSKSYQPLTALIPSLPKGILTGNMAHLFYDSLNLEAEIYLRANRKIDAIVGGGQRDEESPHDVVHALRRRMLAKSLW